MHIGSSGPSNIHGIVGWVQDPNGRGTSSLILSCVLTLGMCVWSALHLNIPTKRETKTQYWLRTARWVALGIFVPELVVLAAWRQWTSARSLSSSIRGLVNDQENGENLSRKCSTASYAATSSKKGGWTSVHSHFAGMGGFAIEIDNTDANPSPYLPEDVSRITLTTHGVMLLARCGHLPYLDVADLDDKSKADGLAKAIVMLQASWMLAQTLGRLILGLPVSLLEVNTLGHVLCAFVIYLLWWHKPREVYEPTPVTGEWVHKLCAYMYMSSRMSGVATAPKIMPRSWHSPELSNLLYVPSKTPSNEQGGYFLERPERHDTIRTATNKRKLGSISRLKSNPTTSLEANSERRAPDDVSQRDLVRSDTTVDSANSTQSQDPELTREQRRRRLALQAIEEFPAIRQRFTPHTPTDAMVKDKSSSNLLQPLEAELQQLVVPEAGNWPSDYLMGRMRGQTMGMALWFASMAYGGVHIAAWNEYFPTPAERLAWHFSAVYITCSGAFWFALNVFAFMVPWAKRWFRRFREFKVHWAQVLLLGIGASACGLCYIFARVYLVVEAVISLRRVPADVYATPNWTDVVPHL